MCYNVDPTIAVYYALQCSPYNCSLLCVTMLTPQLLSIIHYNVDPTIFAIYYVLQYVDPIIAVYYALKC